MVPQVGFDESMGILHGRVVHVRPVPTFEDTGDDYLAWCAAESEPPEQPFSGTLVPKGRGPLPRHPARETGHSAAATAPQLTPGVYHLAPYGLPAGSNTSESNPIPRY